ncbi:MAG: helix-turn-helix domain-containing protein [Segniliparus sp.]|uniref:helix-turn-helix domain-containing protein n=1 Tax=Segniliparus sp. TaxID=2804064 RepID=UPI003F3356DD
MFEWLRAYMRTPDAGLRHTKTTMCALATYADFDTLECYPSQRTLAELTGFSQKAVQRHVSLNLRSGWIVKVRAGNSYKTTNKYRFAYPAAPVGGDSLVRDESGPIPPAGCVPPRQRGMTAPAGDPLSIEGTIQGTTSSLDRNSDSEETAPVLGAGAASWRESSPADATNQDTAPEGGDSSPPAGDGPEVFDPYADPWAPGGVAYCDPSTAQQASGAGLGETEGEYVLSDQEEEWLAQHEASARPRDFDPWEEAPASGRFADPW